MSHPTHQSHWSRSARDVTSERKIEGMRVAHSQQFHTVAEVAALMRVSRMTVYRMIERGDLPAVRFGRSYRVPEAALQAAIADGAAESEAS